MYLHFGCKTTTYITYMNATKEPSKQGGAIGDYEPQLHGTHDIAVKSCLTVHKLINGYNGLIGNECLKLLVDDWKQAEHDGRMDLMTGKGWKIRVKIFSGFKDKFEVHKFCMGIDLDTPQRFRQTTIVELLALGIADASLGLCVNGSDWTYCLGSASVGGHVKHTACGMVDPMIFYPGLESMDGNRQMIARDIYAPGSENTRIALVELKR